MWLHHLVGTLQPYLKTDIKSENTMKSDAVVATPAERSLRKTVNRITLEKRIANGLFWLNDEIEEEFIICSIFLYI